MLWVSSDGLCCWGVGSNVLTNCNNVQNRAFCFLEGTNWLGLGTMCAMDHLWKTLINVPEHRITYKVLGWDLTHNNSLAHGKLSIFLWYILEQITMWFTRNNGQLMFGANLNLERTLSPKRTTPLNHYVCLSLTKIRHPPSGYIDG